MQEKNIVKNKSMSKFISVFLVILAFLYNISPVDFIVDVTPIIGLTDDIIITIAAIVNLYIKWRKK